jgi:SnoaL-like domain
VKGLTLDMFDFTHYLQAFEGADEAAFVKEFYTEDIFVEGPPGVITGHQAWLNALTSIHDRMEERLYPVMVMQDGNTILAEIRGVFTATADRPDFPYGPLKKGESVTVKMLARYEIRGNKISHITLASWPAANSRI